MLLCLCGILWLQDILPHFCFHCFENRRAQKKFQGCSASPPGTRILEASASEQCRGPCVARHCVLCNSFSHTFLASNSVFLPTDACSSLWLTEPRPQGQTQTASIPPDILVTSHTVSEAPCPVSRKQIGICIIPKSMPSPQSREF